MITGMHHTGLVVTDLEKALEFYRDVLGLEVVRVTERQGSEISQIVGYEDTHLKAALLRIGNGHILELIQYISPPPHGRQTEERNTLGAGHLAFDTDDIWATYEDIRRRGAAPLNPPVEVTPGSFGCYFQDPEGNWLEIMEIR